MSPTRRLTRGVYVGDVTALCALPPTGDDAVAADTASDGARPRAHDTLLAGTGASLKWYDPFTAGGDVPLLSTTVFPSARVHGIHPSPELDAFVAGASGASGGRAILVWGERRVSVVTLSAGAGVAPDARTLRVTRALLPLGHWVHDARPMLPDARVAETTVAVGLADNAVEQWSLGGADASASAASSPPALLRRVECSRRSMLYSLALRGGRMADLRVAGGTIFNEVQLWAPDGPSVTAPARSVNSSEARTDDGDEFRRPAPFAILRGHEGSIMRVSWSRDGTRVFSTSDDRTARTWRVADRAPDDEAPATEAEDTASATKKRARAGAVLYGHGGRVWDCQPVRAGSRHLLVTAGEDCAVRLWEDTGRHETGGEETRRDKKAVGREGAEEPKPVATLRGHRGRGVWRCATVRNPRGSETLVTAGADASIKLWDLSEYEAGPSGKGAIDTFAGAATPPAEAEASGTDGSDVPRAVCLAASGAVFVGTERGAVHEARRPRGDEKSVSEMNANNGHGGRSGESGWVWRANLFAEPSGGSIVSVAVVDVPRRDKKRRSADEKRKTPSRDVAPVWLAVGDALGRVTVLSVADGAATATRMWSAQASPPRRLLDVLVGHGGDIFAAVVGGAAALWRCETDHEGEDGNKPPTWVADGVARSPFRQRALRASRRGGVFALGDQSGNVAVFDASGAAVAGSNPGGAEDDAASLPLLAAERGAHGAHSVSFVEVRLGAVGAGEEIGAEIVTGGRDGRLCVFALRARRTPATEEETRRAARRVDFEAAGVAAREAALAAADDTTRKKAARALAAALDRVATARAASVALAAPFRLEREAASRVAGVSSVDGARWDDGAFSFSSADDGFANGDNHAAMAGVSSSPALVAGFRECDFVIRDLRDQTETLRVACGGWKRPFALRMRRGGDGRGGAAPATAETAFAFAFVKGGKLTACVRRGSVGEGGDGEDAEAGAPWRARALNVWSHGREVHTVAIVPPPDDSPGAPAGVLTGSEDGFVLRAAARGDGLGDFFDPAEVGAHVGGAAVRAIALVPDVPGGGLKLPPASEPAEPSAASRQTSPPPPSYTLLTAGAKEVLHAWRVSWERAGSASASAAAGTPPASAWRLRTSLLATRGSLVKPGHAEWTKGCGFVAASVASDQRYMDVAGFAPLAGGPAVALAASSEGAVAAMALERGDSRRGAAGEASARADRNTPASARGGRAPPSGYRWRTIADLRFHDRPVLAVDVAGVFAADGAVAVVAATGATDGSMAIWEMSSAVGEKDSPGSGSVRAFVPSHVTRSAHQSGVNDVAVRGVAGAAGGFVAASGGDDQVARAEVFRVTAEAPPGGSRGDGASGRRFRVVSVARVATPFAHSSAIKGVWLGRGARAGTLTLATTSHDQRVRVWTVASRVAEDAVTMTPSAGAFVECPEPESLDGFVDNRGCARVVVCGRGVQMFDLEVARGVSGSLARRVSS